MRVRTREGRSPDAHRQARELHAVLREGLQVRRLQEEEAEPADDFDALPERFQKYIRALETQVSRLEEAQPVKESTNVKLVDYLMEGGGTFLPNDAKVEFSCSDGLTIVVQIANVKHGFNGIEAMSSNGRGFNVLPRASNCIVIASDALAQKAK